MSIRELISGGRGRAGSGGSWRIVDVPASASYPARRELWHYSTRMLSWNPANPADPAVLDYSTGNGSVSDQGGMNTAFGLLGLPLRFDRDARGGGPRISTLPRV